MLSGAAVLAIAGIAAFVRVASSEPGTFTLGTAVLVAAYLAFPVLLLFAAGLGVIAVLLLAGAAIQRRAAESDRGDMRDSRR